VRLVVVAGPSLVRDDTTRRRADQIEPGFVYTGHYGASVEDSPLTAWRFGVATGADLEIQMGQHVSLVPGMRIHFIRREGDDLANVLLQMSKVVYRPSIGFRARF